MTMTMKKELFVREYCIDWNGTRAAIAAGYAVSGASVTAYDLLRNPEVAAAIDKYKAQVTSKLDLKVEDVVRAIASVIRADARELTESRVGSCRYCWGAYHLYQATPQEFRDRYNAHMQSEAYLERGVEFDSLGGDGYRRSNEPCSDCPECNGEGIMYTIVKDSRGLTGDAVQLYAGIKQTANGVEVLTRSKDKAIEQAAKYLGMNKETVLTGVAPSGLGHFYGETQTDDESSSNT